MNRAPKVFYPTYTVFWSQEDGEFVAVCDWWPGLSWLDKDPEAALSGLMDVLEKTFTEDEALNRRDEINRERGWR